MPKKISSSENISLKIISLILAIALELYFYSPDNSSMISISAQVQLINVPSSVHLVKPQIENRDLTARVRIRGPKPLVEKAQKGIYSFMVNYPVHSPLIFNAHLDPADLNLPTGIDVVDIEPDLIAFEFEKIIHKKIPIEVVKDNSLPAGYYIEKEQVTPDAVIISGPVSLVDRLDKIQTKAVDLLSLNGQMKFDIGLELPNPALKSSAESISLEFNVQQILAQHKFEKVNIKVLAPYGYAATVEPTKGNVTLVGPKTSLDLLKSIKLELNADTRDLKEGKYEVLLKADLPEEVKMLSAEPEKVTVILKKEK